jgi:hypothetical protein
MKMLLCVCVCVCVIHTSLHIDAVEVWSVWAGGGRRDECAASSLVPSLRSHTHTHTHTHTDTHMTSRRHDLFRHYRDLQIQLTPRPYFFFFRKHAHTHTRERARRNPTVCVCVCVCMQVQILKTVMSFNAQQEY